MKNLYSIALISAVAVARCPEETKAAYMGFAAQYGKSPETLEELAERIENFDRNDRLIREMNSKVQGVTFAMNASGDMSDEEYRRSLGIRIPEEAQELKDNKGHSDHGHDQGHSSDHRHLQTSTLNKNWVEEGKVTAVKNQGYCGSCWAFAATTVQESMEAIAYGTTPARLSEQEAVDCVTASHGCGGGWMTHYWEYAKAGARGYFDYAEYTANDNACRTSTSDPISSTTYNYGYSWTIDDALQALQQGPLTVALQAGSKCWQFYQQGVLTAAVANELQCATGIDHGVVITGVHFGSDGDGDGGDGGDGDDGGDDGTDPVDCELNPELCERSCRKATRQEKRSQTCEGEEWNYEEWYNNNGRLRRKCCQYTPIQDVESVQSDAYNVQFSDGVYPDESGVNYWIIQNSWGSGWGEDGFIRIEVTYDDIGIIGMNQYINWMNVA